MSCDTKIPVSCLSFLHPDSLAGLPFFDITRDITLHLSDHARLLHCKTTDLPIVKSGDSASNSKEPGRASQISIKKLVFSISSEKSPLSNPTQWSNRETTPRNWFSDVLWAHLYLPTVSCSGKAFIFSFCTLNFKKHCQIGSPQWLGHRGPALRHVGTYRGACSHRKELNKRDHIHTDGYKKHSYLRYNLCCD